MTTKLLKYGIGIFTPEFPAGFDVSPFEDQPEAKVISIPDGSVSDEPVTVAFDGPADIRIFVGKGARVTFVETATAAPRYARVSLTIGEGAEVSYRIAHDVATAVDVIRREVSLAKDAKLDWAEWVSGPVFARSTTEVKLEGEGASVESKTAYVGAVEQSFDANLRVLHLAPRTRSNLVTKTVLAGKSKAIVRGLVRIPKGIAGCEGFQREDALLLSPTAVASAIPMLEIENNDVKCGHAATTARVDEEKLFYMMSRGLDRDEATKAIVEGFLEPISSLVWTSR